MNDKAAFCSIRDALRVGDTELARQLLHEKPSRIFKVTPFGSWLHVAAAFGNLELVRDLLASGCDINLRSGVSGGTPINEAAAKGHLEVVACLLAAGAGLDVSEPERNPLFSAIYAGRLDVVKILLEAGIDFRVRYTGENMTDMDAASFALERGQTEIADHLKNYETQSA